jgi:hypothetical protein
MEVKKFKKSDIISVDNFWHELFRGGSIKPENLLNDKEDSKKVRDAINVILNYEKELYNSGIIEYL